LLLLLATLFAVPTVVMAWPGWLAFVWMVSILGTPLLTAALAMLLANLVPALVLSGRARRLWTVFPAAAVVSLLLMGAGLLLSLSPSKDRPLNNSVVYAVDFDKGEAWWLSQDEKVDEWTQQFFPDSTHTAIDDILPHKRGKRYLRGAAPVSPSLRGLQCKVLDDAVSDGVRRVTLKLTTEDYPFEGKLRQLEGPPSPAPP